MRNELVGYLVGALETDEQTRVEQEVKSNSQLRGELDVLRRGLVPLAVDEPTFDPPVGLARRTIEFVFARAAATVASQVTRPLPMWNDTPPPTRRWRMADLSVAAGILVAAFSVVVPAILQSRVNAERISCQNRLGQAYFALTDFAKTHNGKLPGPEPRHGVESNVGIYGPMITEAKYLADHTNLICPGSDLANEEVTIPTVAEVRAAKGKHRDELLRVMGGSYSYAVGYFDEKGVYHPLTRRNGDRSPILSDLSNKGGRPIGHHGGCGRNVLFADGSVEYVSTCRLRSINDDIYLNADGEENAGRHPRDIVLLRPETRLRMVSGER
jgi:prepilin-type processing-associated H-X9-DG protein